MIKFQTTNKKSRLKGDFKQVAERIGLEPMHPYSG